MSDAGTLANLGLALAGLKRYREATQAFLEGLKIDLEMRFTPHALATIEGMAHIEVVDGNPKQAVEWLGLVLNHPGASNPDVQALASPLLAKPESELPPEVVAAALERGKELDLETAIRELLEESSPNGHKLRSG